MVIMDAAGICRFTDGDIGSFSDSAGGTGRGLCFGSASNGAGAISFAFGVFGSGCRFLGSSSGSFSSLVRPDCGNWPNSDRFSRSRFCPSCAARALLVEAEASPALSSCVPQTAATTRPTQASRSTTEPQPVIVPECCAGRFCSPLCSSESSLHVTRD